MENVDLTHAKSLKPDQLATASFDNAIAEDHNNHEIVNVSLQLKGLQAKQQKLEKTKKEITKSKSVC